MSDISTFSRWKDWLLLSCVGLVFALLGYIATDNRQRIDDIELELREGRTIRQQGFERLKAIESLVGPDPGFTRQDARELESRLQREIDRLETRVEELRRWKKESR